MNDGALTRRRLRHDIQHEIATVMMLASAIATADDVGKESRTRVQQLVGETRWLGMLLQQLDDDGFIEAPQDRLLTELVRVDLLVAEIADAMRLSTATAVASSGQTAYAHVDRLALWRAVRNMLDNACRAAGPSGRVTARVLVESGWTVVEIDDDGPGFGARVKGGLASLGFGIIHDFVVEYGGSMELSQAELGGACVRIQLPAAAAPGYSTEWEPEADEVSHL
ncbi:sensor histidine kinase [Nonomuraea sp. NPDC050536]|uniref:sensor histidine kinase n=1 Tax=Nonomuraea sp. NPDC050536 TaxID=3364366 RepID=UPI0037C88087